MADIDLCFAVGFSAAFGRLTAEEKAEYYRVVADQVALAVAAERERCAKIAETNPGACQSGCDTGVDIAAKIRSGE